MKIGILTFHRSLNNGALIQCYSLFSRIKKDFPHCTVEVIDYDMPILTKIYPMNLKDYYKYCTGFINAAKKTKALIKDPKYIKRFRIKRRAFDEALNNISLSSKKIVSNDPTELFRFIDENYDAVVAGSDAIWNYTLRGFPNPYFLDKSISIPMLSYAASCYGMNYESIPQNEKSSIKDILSAYKFVGVRDSETEKMFDFLGCGNTCEHTCDPTLLLDVGSLPVDKEAFREKLASRGFDFNRKTIGLMISDELATGIKKMMGDSYQYVSLFNYNKCVDINLFDLSPFEWAYVFRFFDITFTTYFHGTLLSLKNDTPVIALALKNEFNKNHMSKVEDALGRLDLKDSYFDFSEENIPAIRKKAEEMLKDFDCGLLHDKIGEEAGSYEKFRKELQVIVG